MRAVQKKKGSEGKKRGDGGLARELFFSVQLPVLTLAFSRLHLTTCHAFQSRTSYQFDGNVFVLELWSVSDSGFSDLERLFLTVLSERRGAIGQFLLGLTDCVKTPQVCTRK